MVELVDCHVHYMKELVDCDVEHVDCDVHCMVEIEILMFTVWRAFGV